MYTNAREMSRQKTKGDNEKMQTSKNMGVPFQKIAEASRTTGLSQYYLRRGCKNGTVPHVRCGSVYMVNIASLLRQLNADGEAVNAQ